MAKIPPESVMLGLRGVSSKGRFYTRIVNGKVFASSWPSPQKTPIGEKQKAATKLLGQAARATTMMSPGAVAFATDLAKQSKLLPRDFLMIQLFNRVGYLVRENGTKVYSMAAVQDVSNLLDTIAQLKGMMLLRGEDWWVPLFPGTVGQVLTIDADGNVTWEDVSTGGSTGEPFMAAPQLNPTTPAATFGADTIVAYPILPSQSMVISGTKLWASAIGAGRQIYSGIYQSNGLTMAGGTKLGQSIAGAAVAGLNTLPFTSPIPLTGGQFYWHFLCTRLGSGNLQLMKADVPKDNYEYFGVASSTAPNTAPAVTPGLGGYQFSWWGF